MMEAGGHSPHPVVDHDHVGRGNLADRGKLVAGHADDDMCCACAETSAVVHRAAALVRVVVTPERSVNVVLLEEVLE